MLMLKNSTFWIILAEFCNSLLVCILDVTGDPHFATDVATPTLRPPLCDRRSNPHFATDVATPTLRPPLISFMKVKTT